MHRPRTGTVALFTGLLLLGCGVVRAEQLNFSYSVSLGTGDLTAWGSGGLSGPAGPVTLSQSVGPGGSSVTINYGSGATTMPAASPGPASAAPGGAGFFSATPPALPLGSFPPTR